MKANPVINFAYNAGVFLYETPIPLIITAIAAIAAAVLYPPVAVPLGIVLGGALLTRLVVKAVEHYNTTFAAKLKAQFCRLPALELAFIVATVVFGVFCLYGGIFAGAFAALYLGARSIALDINASGKTREEVELFEV